MNNEEKEHKPSAVSAVFSSVAPSGYKDSSPVSSDWGYGSDNGSDTNEGINETKKSLYAYDTYKAVQEEETRPPSFRAIWKPAQSRTISLLQRQLE